MFPPAAIFTLITSLFIILPTSSSTIAGDEKTVYEALQDYDFPVGLLPQGARNYELNEKTGQFKVFLKDSSCAFSIKGYHLRYKSTISGVISNDRIKNLKGISVQILRLWFNIVEISRRDDKLEFSAAGIASAYFAVTTFAKCPQCGCGFKCAERNYSYDDVNLKKHLVSADLVSQEMEIQIL